MTAFGFIGLGTIGGPMAQALLRGGLGVIAFDPRASALDVIVEAGASSGTSASDVASRADIIGVCVVNDDQVRSVVWGPEGIAQGARPGTIVVLHSTILPTTVRTIGEGLAEIGVRLVDAQVSGGDLRALNGTLAIMAGGSELDVAECSQYLRALGAEVRHMGPLGAGAAAKLALQEMAFVNQLAALEAARFAESNGISETALMDLATFTTAASFTTENWGYFDRQLFTHLLAGTEDLYRFYDKDLLNLCIASRECALTMPLAALALQLLGPSLKERRAELEARGIVYH